MTSTTQGKSEAEQMDEMFDQALEEMEEDTPEDSSRIPESDDYQEESETDTMDSPTTPAKPSGKQNDATREQEDFSELFEEPEKQREDQRKKSALGQFKAKTKNVLAGDEDFDELTPWLKKGVVSSLVEMIEREEIDVEDIPDEKLQERVSKKYSLLEEEKQQEKQKEKQDGERNVKAAQLKLLSREITNEDYPTYAKSLKKTLRLMPKASMEEVHHFAKLDANIQSSGGRTAQAVPSRRRSPRPFGTQKYISSGDIESASNEEVAKWLFQ